MKSLLLAFVASVVCFTIITAILKTVQVRRKAALMVRIFLITLPFFMAIHMASPPDLGILPQILTEPSRWVDLGLGVFIYSAAFFGGILQVYNLADRGFSLRMLIDIGESPRGILTADEMLTGYSRGRGLDWMYQKRLDGLLDQRLIRIVNGTVRGTETGRIVALVYDWLRTFLRLRAGV